MLISVNFDYIKPKTLDELDATAGGFIISGGTVGVRLLKERLIRPKLVVNISGLAEAEGIKIDGETVDVGASVKIYQLEGFPSQGPLSEMLRFVASGIADPAIRTMGSVGGNIALADPSNELPIPFMLADATLLIYGQHRFREEKIRGFIKGPHRTGLAPGEVILRVRYRELNGYRWSYKKHFIRNLDHYTGISGVVAKVEDGLIKDLRVVIAGEAVKGFKYMEPASARGVSPGKLMINDIIEEALKGLRPESDRQGPAEYKLKVLRRLLELSLKEVLGA